MRSTGAPAGKCAGALPRRGRTATAPAVMRPIQVPHPRVSGRSAPDCYAWSLAGVRNLVRRPVVHGTWYGELASDGNHPETGQRIAPTWHSRSP
jgi:hypothetical protein